MAEITLKPEATTLSLDDKPLLQQALLVAGASVLVALCAHLSLPLFFTPVPLSLAPFAVLLVGLFLSPAAAASALALYLVEGAAGLPVFSPTGPGGFLQLAGPTGGYLLSYPAAAAVASWLYRRFRPSFAAAAFAAALASFVILAAGASWFAILTHRDAGLTLRLAVLPFLAGDALKVCAAAAIVTAWRRVRTSRDQTRESL